MEEKQRSWKLQALTIVEITVSIIPYAGYSSRHFVTFWLELYKEWFSMIVF